MTSLCRHFSETFEIIDGYKVYDLEQCLKYITYQGKLHYGQCFRIDPLDLPTVRLLLIYMIQDREAAKAAKIDLGKGILLTGPIGCGKSSMMHLLQAFAPARSLYKIKNCRDVTFEFSKIGFDTIQKYSRQHHFQSRLTGYCFDDLGAEHQIKHFGNECNVMAEVLISRYEHFVEQHCITHLTSNLSASEIEQYYGNRVRSRMRSMFNQISFDMHSRDKRRDGGWRLEDRG